MRYFLQMILIVLILGCSNIELKEKPEERIPFKIEEGNYKVSLYEINYPEGIIGKNDFYEQLDIFVQKTFLNDKKYNLLITETFYNDLNKIKNGILLEDEDILVKVASSFTDKEKEKIENLVDYNDFEYPDTSQGFLDRQIYILEKLLNGTDNGYDPQKRYTELDKEILLNDLKQQRKKTYNILTKTNIEFIIKLTSLYEKEKRSENRYYYSKDIVLEEKEKEVKDNIKNYKMPIYLQDINEDEIQNITEGKLDLSNKYVLINNNNIGYKYLNDTYYIYYKIKKEEIENSIYTYPKYKINIYVEEDTNLEELIQINDEYNFSDIFGG